MRFLGIGDPQPPILVKPPLPSGHLGQRSWRGAGRPSEPRRAAARAHTALEEQSPRPAWSCSPKATSFLM